MFHNYKRCGVSVYLTLGDVFYEAGSRCIRIPSAVQLDYAALHLALLIANVEIVLKNRHGNILYTKNDCVIIIGRKRKGGF